MEFTVKNILKMEVAPALGCTEPTAVALSAATARSILRGKDIDFINVTVDSNVYKNGFAVSIPGAEKHTGIDVAAALGAFGGDPAKKLEVLDSVTPESLKTAVAFVKAGKVRIDVKEGQVGIFIHTEIRAGEESAEARIEQTHDNITRMLRNGKDLPCSALLFSIQESKTELAELEAWLKTLNLEQLLALLDDLDEEDLSFLKKGVETNLRLADYGLMHGPGLAVGSTLNRLMREGILKKDIIYSAKMLTSAASDARMSGVKLPAMSSAGSGNHGLTAILPLWAVKDYLVCSEIEVLKAIGFSHIITGYIKAFTGRLTAVCGCSIAAGAGATAGITYLMGGNLRHIAGAIKNIIGDLAGVICDGAKAGCSMKLSTAAGAAVQAALFSLRGITIQSTDGIIGDSGEDTMRNIGELSTQGMVGADRTILNIMVNKKFVIPDGS